MSDDKSHYLERELQELMCDSATLKFLDEAVLDGIWYWDLENPENEYMSDTFWRTLGFDPAGRQHLAAEWQDLIYPEDGQLALAAVQRHMNDPTEPYDQFVRYHTADGGTATVRCRGLVIRRDGKPVRMLGAHTLTHDTHRADLQAHLSELMELSGEAIVVQSGQSGIEVWNRGAETMFGIVKSRALGTSLQMLTDARVDIGWDEVEGLLSAGRDWEGLIHHTRPDGSTLVTLTRIARMTVADGETYDLLFSRDETERHALAQQQTLILNELKHRVMNLFSVIQSIIAIAARSESDRDAFAASVLQRVNALSAAYKVSFERGPQQEADLRDLLCRILDAFGRDDNALTMTGPEVTVPADAITPLGLLIHEFATNAIKHGAWHDALGRIAVNWSLEPIARQNGKDGDGATSVMRLVWTEHHTAGRSPASDPGTTGFGSILIKGAVRQLNARLTREDNGQDYVLTLEMPVQKHAEN